MSEPMTDHREALRDWSRTCSTIESPTVPVVKRILGDDLSPANLLRQVATLQALWLAEMMKEQVPHDQIAMLMCRASGVVAQAYLELTEDPEETPSE